MPRVIDYELVLGQMRSDGLRSLYHNSGAFGFHPSDKPLYRGWLGPPDPTIRPAALEVARHVPEPFAPTLAAMARAVWLEHLPGGEAWVMPMSHWAYELDFGSAGWMPDALRDAGVDPATLRPRNSGDAIGFDPNGPGEADAFQRLLASLLARLTASDFMIAFPGRRTLCTVHHHRQLWWQTTRAEVVTAIDATAERRTDDPSLTKANDAE